MTRTTDRTVLCLTGADRTEFLQGLITNDIKGLSDGMLYAAMLTPQGKYLADFFLIATDDGILLDVHSSLAPGLTQRLTMYKLRADVQISATDIVPARGLSETPEGAFPDPRHPDMGWRAYDGRPSEQGDFDAVRVAHVIPETGIELSSESYILEAGFERLHGVDFRKGCYVGQEVTARMKHKTELRKGLVQVRISGHAPVGTEITASGKPAGTLFTQSGGLAIAYLRFDRASGEMMAGDAKVSWPA
ncbi:YgfZ/GcvT domain-containing protein [Aliiroseovarius lamellibrachiae]|uniref:CAF17-like 4Fe-4S cluster assembly/insertion protein YgfZ n=1 Tax=Aliiroseovarius lamellibrachiae TaxID=1924933 RepID=UPI001BE0933D|nr:folate-binding protein [Aliiroseovarius lamellibrachiae]MBT2130030.1 folate-binding protein [Aliiroseovarius lamellibrachiae]